MYSMVKVHSLLCGLLFCLSEKKNTPVSNSLKIENRILLSTDRSSINVGLMSCLGCKRLLRI